MVVEEPALFPAEQELREQANSVLISYYFSDIQVALQLDICFLVQFGQLFVPCTANQTAHQKLWQK
jgi:hypothetical protein